MARRIHGLQPRKLKKRGFRTTVVTRKPKNCQWQSRYAIIRLTPFLSNQVALMDESCRDTSRFSGYIFE